MNENDATLLGMHAEERRACENELALARERVKVFYQACVPQSRRSCFVEYALKECPEQMLEIEELKKKISEEPRCVPSYTAACNRWCYLSKEVVRRVSFVLARKVLP